MPTIIKLAGELKGYNNEIKIGNLIIKISLFTNFVKINAMVKMF